MMNRSLRTPLLAALACGALFLASCLETSTVVQVTKDGSGEIHASHYFSQQMVGMLGMAAGFGGGADAAAAPPNPEELLKPGAEKLAEEASAYGEGVRYLRHEHGRNEQGWEGYSAVYAFDDINQLRFDPENMPGPFSDLSQGGSGPEAAGAGDGEESQVAFSMADGVLTLDTGMSPEKIAELGNADGGLGGGLPDNNPAALQMMAGMFQGMRISYAIRAEGGIAETNASHVEDGVITVLDVQPAKVMVDPEFQAVTKEAEALQAQGGQIDAAQVEALMEKIQAIDGITFETREQVTVRLQ